MRDSRGFTFVELMVVVTLLAILSLLGITGYELQVKKARDAQRKASLNEMRVALLNYQDDNGCFPEVEDMYCRSGVLDPYLKEIPCDPKDNDPYRYEYVKDGCSTFHVYTRLENESDDVIAKVGCAGGCGPGEETKYNYYVTSGDEAAESVEPSGIPPTCGSANKYCYPGVCSTCCPGTNHRCNSTGDACVLDVSCSQ